MNDLYPLLQDWLPLLVGAVVFFLVYTIWLISSAKELEHRVETRLQLFAEPTRSAPTRRRILAGLESEIENSWLGRHIRRLLNDSNLSWSMFTFLLVVLSIFPIFMAATTIIFQMSLQLNLIFSSFGTVGVILYYLNERRGARERALQSQTPEIALLLSNSLKAGMALRQALPEVKDKLSNPAAEEFRKLVHQMNLGQSLEDTLQQFLEQHPGESMRMLVTALVTQSKAGGDLVKTLAAISSAVLARQRVTEEVYAATTQARYTSLAIMILPLIILGLINMMTDGMVSNFINRPAGFIFFLIVYVVPQVIAQLLIRKVSKVQV